MQRTKTLANKLTHASHKMQKNKCHEQDPEF